MRKDTFIARRSIIKPKFSPSGKYVSLTTPQESPKMFRYLIRQITKFIHFEWPGKSVHFISVAITTAIVNH